MYVISWTIFVQKLLIAAGGSGAFGHFESTKDMSHLTKVSCRGEEGYMKLIFLYGRVSSTAQGPPVFIRYSTVTLGREFPDLARNPRGFAVKFYTGEGNYDLVGLSWVSCSNFQSTAC